MEPGEAFILVLTGAVCVYGEFLRPGRVVPGLAGSLMAIAGVHGLSRIQLSRTGMLLVGTAAALFLLEAFCRLDFVAGVAATVLLAVGSSLLVRDPSHLSPALTIPACIVFGGVTIFLCWQAKRARRNKWQDLSDGAAA